MTERSLPWADAGSGDAGPYTHDELRLLVQALGGGELGANQGVIGGALNSLQPTSPGDNQVRGDSGRAVVNGTLYEADAAVTFGAPADFALPIVGLTGKRLVLRKDWTAQEVRLAVIESSDGDSALPALTQDDGDIWEIPLASFLHNTTGAISAFTDEREFTRPAYANLIIDGGGVALVAGEVFYFRAPKMIIGQWEVVADVSGSIVIDVAHEAAAFPPALPTFPGDSIAGSEKPTLAAAQTNNDNNLASWTRNIAEGWMGVKIDSAATVKRVTLALRGYRL